MDLISQVRDRQFQTRYINQVLSSVLRLCNDSTALAKAKDLVPVSAIVQDNLDILDDEFYLDNLLPHLVNWFKSEFFSWFVPPSKCGQCSSQLNSNATCRRNSQGLLVECYSCTQESCSNVFEFTRHKDPKVLLQTRTGRCGEWADCFFLFLCALDYDARIVHDHSDHVWNEVWSEKKQRWLHVDPCEGAIDSPLLYEVGWSKKLEYCLAFSRFSAIDATPRYCLNWNETKQRRKSCSESWLSDCIDFITEELLRTAPSEEVRDLVRTRRKQDCEFLAKISEKPQKVPSKSEFQQRKTGSISWRIERGEYSPIVTNDYVIVCLPNSSEQTGAPLFELAYNCYKDKYESNNSNEEHCKVGWLSLTYRSENVDRKHESDWHTSYLARYETCPHDKTGKIVWRLDLTKLEGRQKRLEIFISGKIYSDTTIDLTLRTFLNRQAANDENPPLGEHKLDLNKTNTITTDDIAKVQLMELVASISGGNENDNVAWQKPQLFRQTRNQNENEPAFLWRIF